MTYSILVHDPDTGEIGGAAVTGNLAVGAWVLFAQVDTGLVATQGFSVSTLWGQEALRLLSEGFDPETIVENLTTNDTGAGSRQLIVIDGQGRSAGWSGKDNYAVKDHHVERGLAIAGNWLANDQVLKTLRDEYVSATGDMASRLLHAISAASRDGGDSRGMMSAAIKIVGPDRPPLDLRIDCSNTPVIDLIALWNKTKSPEYQEFLNRLPTAGDTSRC